MCGAGVVDATAYGTYLFILKIVNLYVFAYWLMLHDIDSKDEKQPHTRLKFAIFIGAFFLFLCELALEGLMFSAIDVDKMVSCCGTLYSSTSTSYVSNIFLIKTPVLLSLFYGNFFLLGIFYILKNRYLFAVGNFIFIVISLVSLIAFFGTYIYELPTHHCPFCFLQKDYYYVGYLIYILLFSGTFYGVAVGFVQSKGNEKNYKISMIFITLYVVLVSLYPVFYFIKNGVWL